MSPLYIERRKKIGLFAATALGVSSIMGSAWLFVPHQAAVLAGPGAVVAWVIATFIIILLAICFAEIAALYPRRGLSAIIPTLSHNKYFGFPFAIANWLGVVAVIGLEADATIQYLINLFPQIKTFFYHTDQLTAWGNLFSIGLVFFFTVVNYWGAKSLIKANNIFAIIKLPVPIFIAILLIYTAFHRENFTIVNHSFLPYGYISLFKAILTSGIIVAFNGFQTIIAFSSEINKASRTIPLAMIIAILVCLGVYILIQIAYIGAMPTSLLAQGWAHLDFNAPIIQLLQLVGLGIFGIVVYAGATLAPTGSAIAFTGTASRMLTAMSREQQMPAFFNEVHATYGVSRRSLIFNAFIAVIFLILFRSWGSLAQVLSLFHIISYVPVPVTLWILRGKISKRRYLFRIPFGKVIAFFVFQFFTYLFTLAALAIVAKLMMIFAIFLFIFILTHTRTRQNLFEVFQQIWSLLVYFLSLFILTFISPVNHAFFTQPQFLLISIVWGTILFYLLLITERKDVDIVKLPMS